MSTTTNLALNEPAYNSTSPTWDQPLNYNSTILDKMFGNTTSISLPTGASAYTNIAAPSSTASGLTSQAMRFLFTGALSANQVVLLPQNVAGMWIVTNGTSGAYTVSVGSNNGSNLPAGNILNVPQGYNIIVFSDGTNVGISDNGLLQSNLPILGSTVSDSIGNLRTIVQNSQNSSYTLQVTDNGKLINITTGGVIVPAGIFSLGQNIVIFNYSGSNQTITQGSSVTIYLAGTTYTGNRSLASYGIATLVCVDTNTFVISGSGLT